MTKKLIPTENSKTNRQYKNATKNFDYITIADWFRTVGKSNNSHPTVVVKPGLKGTNLLTRRKSSIINRIWYDRNIVYDTNRLSQR